MEIKERETKIWNGTHDGIDFEINNFKLGDNINWTYYLLIRLNRIPEENNPESYWLKGEADKKGYVNYKYMSTEPICNIEFHHGITYYSKVSGFDGANKIIKIGCDYSHLWDEGRHYSLESVKNDVIMSINSFKGLVPKYKYWCYGNGGLYNLDEGEYKNDMFLSN